jgi:mercuric ion transport protein
LLLRLPELRVRLHAGQRLLREVLWAVSGSFDRSPETAGPPPREHVGLAYLGLFSSVGTLVCCALPSLLVLVGLGATVASILATAPWLVTLSQQKQWVFAVSAALITANFYYVYRLAPRLLAARGVCAADDAEACDRATRANRRLLWVSTLLLLIGFFVAYVLPAALGWLDQ